MPGEAVGRIRAVLLGLFSITAACSFALVPDAALAQDLPRHWDIKTAQSLLAYAERIDRHGLDPVDYSPAELEQAIGSGNPARIERQATDTFARIASDLAIGAVKPGRRGRYFIASDSIDPARMARLIDTAITAGSVAHVLDAVAPQNRQYAGLRRALSRLAPEQGEQRRKIEVSLERWRWLPRNLGNRYLLVNIPEYRLRLIDNDQEMATHRVIVGKSQTPTPQFSAQITGVILNPSWNVPQSIIAESVGSLVRNRPQVARARGYIWSYSGGGLRVTQQPGPQNALGQMKLDMPNPLSVYIHDTPNKELFERDTRTFSHGCVRTEDPFDLAEALLRQSGIPRSEIDAGVAARRTKRMPLADPIPVYVVYMTAVVGAGDSIDFVADPYKLDDEIAVQLE